MYKKIIVLLIISLLICLVGCTNKEKHYGIDAKTIGFETLEDMEKFSDVIIKGVRENEEVPMVKTNEGVMVSGYTLSQLRITEIYKDNMNELCVDDVVTILENEVYNKEENIVYHIAGYNMMEVGSEYILFLKKNILPDGKVYYVSAGVNYGTVSLENDNRMTQWDNRRGDSVIDFTRVEPIWKAAIEKYSN